MSPNVAEGEPLIQCSDEEWNARLDLACCYRLLWELGWHSLIYNHITLRIPGPQAHFLINPFGLMYWEVTASNLLKVDLDGNILVDSPWPLLEAGYVVHAGIHKQREDLTCVIHTHNEAAVTIACQDGGLLPLDINALRFTGRIAYHDLEGITSRRDEKNRIAESLGDKSILILRNHGLVVAGRTIGEAFEDLWIFDMACRNQLACQSSSAPLITREDLGRAIAVQAKSDPAIPSSEVLWAAMRRWMDKMHPDYRS